ncbi:serine/threonine protein phosphatase 1 [Geobacter argillaceus]|uniref:Serine/threonine protein phosphatase 1 n=1 Tax=Geobacter argillaceus TaxID=345631 RepID=A0A562W910_9BACT|nr:serine/threonine protein phosphatase 1 [Geobacter argillaceus]
MEERLGLTQEDELYLLGDLIDRGPAVREVLEFLIGLQEAGYAVASIMGNHEDMCLEACRDRSRFYLWMLNGGHATLRSFGVEDACEIPERYHRFFVALPTHILLPDFALVHAGMDCGQPDPFADRQTLLWSRSCIVDPARIGGRRVVSGHTPRTRQEIEASVAENWIVLDNGCVYRGVAGFGNLAALSLDTLRLYFQENCDC